MNNIGIIITAVVIFVLMNLLFYLGMNGYVGKAFGKKWLNLWGSKLYFWQSSIMVSTGGTFLVMYLLKWTQVLTF
jgi:hypothetical protein